MTTHVDPPLAQDAESAAEPGVQADARAAVPHESEPPPACVLDAADPPAADPPAAVPSGDGVAALVGGAGKDPVAVMLCAAVAARPVREVVRLVRLLVPVLGDELQQALRVAALVRPVEEVAELSGALGGADGGRLRLADGRGLPAEDGPRPEREGEREGQRDPGVRAGEAGGARALGGARRVRGAAWPAWTAALALLVAAAAEFAGRWSPEAGRTVPVWSVPLGAGAVVVAWLLVRRGGSLGGWLAAAVVCAVPLAGRLLGMVGAPGGWPGWTAIGAEAVVLLLAVCVLPGHRPSVGAGTGAGAARRRSTDGRGADSVTRAIDELN